MSRSKEAFLALPERPVSKPEPRYCATCKAPLVSEADGWNLCADCLAAVFQGQLEDAPDVCHEDAA